MSEDVRAERLNALADQMDALLQYANGTTGAGDTRIGDAVKTLADGYGQGGGGKTEVWETVTGTMEGGSFVGTVHDLCEIDDSTTTVFVTITQTAAYASGLTASGVAVGMSTDIYTVRNAFANAFHATSYTNRRANWLFRIIGGRVMYFTTVSNGSAAGSPGTIMSSTSMATQFYEKNTNKIRFTSNSNNYSLPPISYTIRFNKFV